MASRVNGIPPGGSVHPRRLEREPDEQQPADDGADQAPVDRAGQGVDLAGQGAEGIVAHEQRVLDHGPPPRRASTTVPYAGYPNGRGGSIRGPITSQVSFTGYIDGPWRGNA